MTTAMQRELAATVVDALCVTEMFREVRIAMVMDAFARVQRETVEAAIAALRQQVGGCCKECDAACNVGTVAIRALAAETDGDSDE